jgi:hypothetical protein
MTALLIILAAASIALAIEHWQRCRREKDASIAFEMMLDSRS